MAQTEPNTSPILAEMRIMNVRTSETRDAPIDIWLRIHADHTVSWSPQSVYATKGTPGNEWQEPDHGPGIQEKFQ